MVAAVDPLDEAMEVMVYAVIVIVVEVPDTVHYIHLE